MPQRPTMTEKFKERMRRDDEAVKAVNEGVFMTTNISEAESLNARCRRVWVCKRCGNCPDHCKHKNESNFHEDLSMPCSVRLPTRLNTRTVSPTPIDTAKLFAGHQITCACVREAPDGYWIGNPALCDCGANVCRHPGAHTSFCNYGKPTAQREGEVRRVPTLEEINDRLQPSPTQESALAREIVDRFRFELAPTETMRFLNTEPLVESIASALTAERTKALEEAAKAQCQFCAAPETYKAAALTEGSMRLWHLRHDNRESQHFQCEAAAIRTLIGTPLLP